MHKFMNDCTMIIDRLEIKLNFNSPCVLRKFYGVCVDHACSGTTACALVCLVICP